MGQLEGAAMLDDDEAALAEKWGEAEDAVVLVFFGVGRVDENEIEWWVRGLVAGGEFLESAQGVEGKDLCSVGDCERFEIAADESRGGGMVFDEDDVDGAAACSFDTDRAGAGEDVEEARAGDVGAEDVEEGFAEAIAGGTEGGALEAFEDSAAIFAGDDAHLLEESYGGMGAGDNRKKKT